MHKSKEILKIFTTIKPEETEMTFWQSGLKIVSAILIACFCNLMLFAEGTAEDVAQKRWYGVHFVIRTRDKLPVLKQIIKEELVPLGINVIVLEVDYSFQFKSHPELVKSTTCITKEDARDLVEFCRKHSVQLIPQFCCLAQGKTSPFLVEYPDLDETPQISKDNKDIYNRSWCPLHPNVNKIVFDLMDELIDAFQSKYFHVGMDEVFQIANTQCVRCQGKNQAELFAKAVNDYYNHLVKKRKMTMLMWGDRLISGDLGYDKCESDRGTGTAPAVDLIPNDIIICDWHYGYGGRKEYPSVPYFLNKGFRIWPVPWKRVEQALLFWDDAQRHAAELKKTDKIMGFLFTTWTSNLDDLARGFQDEEAVLERQSHRGVVTTIRTCMEKINPKQ